MAVTNAAWDGSASRWDTAQAYAKACLINENTGDPKDWTKDKAKLPVYEPNGDLNSNAVHAAAAALAGGRGGVQASPASKKSAAKKLLGMYRELKEDPPDSLKRIAGN